MKGRITVSRCVESSRSYVIPLKTSDSFTAENYETNNSLLFEHELMKDSAIGWNPLDNTLNKKGCVGVLFDTDLEVYCDGKFWHHVPLCIFNRIFLKETTYTRLLKKYESKL